MPDPNFESLDPTFEQALDVAKGEQGTLYLQTNTYSGHAAVRIQIHPRLAINLAEWIRKNYQNDLPPS